LRRVFRKQNRSEEKAENAFSFYQFAAHDPRFRSVRCVTEEDRTLPENRGFPLRGSCRRQATDEVFRETNALRSSDPQKLTLFCVSASSASFLGVYTPLRFVSAVPSRVKSRVAISSTQGEGLWLKPSSSASLPKPFPRV